MEDVFLGTLLGGRDVARREHPVPEIRDEDLQRRELDRLLQLQLSLEVALLVLILLEELEQL